MDVVVGDPHDDVAPSALQVAERVFERRPGTDRGRRRRERRAVDRMRADGADRAVREHHAQVVADRVRLLLGADGDDDPPDDRVDRRSRARRAACGRPFSQAHRFAPRCVQSAGSNGLNGPSGTCSSSASSDTWCGSPAAGSYAATTTYASGRPAAPPISSSTISSLERDPLAAVPLAPRLGVGVEPQVADTAGGRRRPAVQRRAHRVQPRGVDRAGLAVETGLQRRRAVLVDARVEQAHRLAQRVQVEAHGAAGDAARERDVLGTAVDRAPPARSGTAAGATGTPRGSAGSAAARPATGARKSGMRANGSNGVSSSASVDGSRSTAVPPRTTVWRSTVVAAYGGSAACVGPLVVEVLRPREVLEQLGGVDAPAGERLGDRLDRAERALAPAPADRAGDVAPDRGRIAGEVRRAEQVRDVRDRPRVARLDEEVVVERLDVLVDGAERLLEQREQGAQRLAGSPAWRPRSGRPRAAGRRAGRGRSRRSTPATAARSMSRKPQHAVRWARERPVARPASRAHDTPLTCWITPVTCVVCSAWPNRRRFTLNSPSGAGSTPSASRVAARTASAS